MSIQPGQGPVLPALAVDVDPDEDDVTLDEGVPVGAADLEADKQNASERSESSSEEDSD